ncbi:nucleoside-diphosphate sugar epimerase/dehydratase [Terrabacter aeriphilus]|uniref:Nucleoside-diphosphate sugar epimerase/dehydratase n=2 Tax=Terrabacter aeriphilus TaxID=515662 RepID=A0ABP9J775_9MICO
MPSIAIGPRAPRWPRLLLMLLDVALLVLVLAVLAAARYDLTFSVKNRPGVALAMGLSAAVYLVTYGLLVARRYRWASTDEMLGLGITALCLGASLSAASVLTDPSIVPLSVAVTIAPSAGSAWLVLRYAAVRIHRARQRRDRRGGRRAVVVGAGSGGQQAVAMMLQDSRAALHPVALVDDDPAKRHLGVLGVRVAGRIDDLDEVVRSTEAEIILFAIPSAPAATVERVVHVAAESGCELLVLPSFSEMLTSEGAPAGPGRRVGSQVELPRQAFRPVLLEDLLGRGSVETNTEAIASYLDGKTVLVTGAGGSIGSQLCREIAQYSPARLVMTDRDDSLLHAVQLSIDGQGALESRDLVLGDLRTPGFITDLITDIRPDVVFHAAAIKHLTLAERFPAEAFLTNVVATADLLRACVAADVDRFVNISTDKAADPRSVLGYTKRTTELLTATFGTTASDDARYMSVRFGNVLGSRGSALTTFAAQLAAGRPITITSPDMTRYFMTVHEACQLVLQAAVDGETGDGLVLDMGTAHNIEQLARRFAALQGFAEPRIVYTGARPGEKLAETTLAAGEPDERPFHPLISRVRIPVLPRDLLLDITELRTGVVTSGGVQLVRDWLRDAVGVVAPPPAPGVEDASTSLVGPTPGPTSGPTPGPASEAEDDATAHHAPDHHDRTAWTSHS